VLPASTAPPPAPEYKPVRRHTRRRWPSNNPPRALLGLQHAQTPARRPPVVSLCPLIPEAARWRARRSNVPRIQTRRSRRVSPKPHSDARWPPLLLQPPSPPGSFGAAMVSDISSMARRAALPGRSFPRLSVSRTGKRRAKRNRRKTRPGAPQINNSRLQREYKKSQSRTNI